MDTQALIAAFETEFQNIKRPGADKLLEYIRKSDFYSAPASTRFHLSCPGGLLQHSLNVLDALRGLLTWSDAEEIWRYNVAGKTVDTLKDESAIIMALSHDICKTHFYALSIRNVKDKATGRWEEKPYYTVDDKMPLGHGPKSAMIVKEYMHLTTQEMYAIWHHMGFTGGQDDLTFRAAVEQYPIIWALHTADMMATAVMEGAEDNKGPFLIGTKGDNRI